jgi:hypothetical protein
MKTIAAVLLLCSLCSAEDYWTPRRKIETVGVTALHMADAAQTCYHLHQGDWKEYGPLTAKTCGLGATEIVAFGPVLQFASYKMTRKYPESRLWRMVDRGIPHLEMTLSVNAIHCSNTKAGCNRYGF